MPQLPTQEKAVELNKKYVGLNDNSDSVARPPGTNTEAINIYDQQAGDENRREGRDFSSLQSGAIGLIAQLTWDDGSISFIGNPAGSLDFDTTYSKLDGTIDLMDVNSPGPMPTAPWFLPFWAGTISQVPDYTTLMRNLADARVYINSSVDDTTWPNQVWAFDAYSGPRDLSLPPSFGRVIQNGRTKEAFLAAKTAGLKIYPTKSYPVVPVVVGSARKLPVDFYYLDYIFDSSLPAQHLNYIKDVFNNPLLTTGIRPYYTANSEWTGFFNGVADYSATINSGNQDEACLGLAEAINSLVYVPVQGSVTNVGQFQISVIAGTEANAKICIENWIENNSPAFLFGVPGNARFIGLNGGGANCIEVVNFIGGGSYQVPQIYAGGGAVLFMSTTDIVFDLQAIPDIDIYLNVVTANVRAFMKRINVFESAEIRLDWPAPSPKTSDAGAWSLWGAASPSAKTRNQIHVFETDVMPSILPYLNSPPINQGSRVGWEVIDQVCICGRQMPNRAVCRNGGSPTASILITPDEYFTLSASQTIVGTVETDIIWDRVKTTSSGGASPSYPPPNAVGNAVPISPSSILIYDYQAGGFSASRFLQDYYRPTVLLQYQYGFSQLDVATTQFTLRLYINTTLVDTRIISLIPPCSDLIVWAFSIKDVGDFTTFRPPQNDPNNDLDGWANSAQVRITVEPAAPGGMIANTLNKLLDFVVNYPV